ncbi:unnamed protein product [Prorocentrum cordatum]|uniref:Uncharacterized protein n=1 Tax=Prorocentrum cordatum TaxID=2364126 RepID=A0ABN9XEL8_9DINO|nr:unnamed protein product [Polarella glacialis]
MRILQGQEDTADAGPRPGARPGAMPLSKLPSHAAFNLRQFSMGRQRLGMQRALSQPLCSSSSVGTLKERERQRRQAAHLEAWRQREEDERGLEEAARQEAQRAADRERQRLQSARRELEEQARHKAFTAAMRRKEEREEQERQARELERQTREALEQQRLRQEEEERQRRAPKVCELCAATGVCGPCQGTGLKVQDFLVPSTRCHRCGGLGKVWPHLEEDEDYFGNRRTRSSTHGVGWRKTRSRSSISKSQPGNTSPKSPISSRQPSCAPATPTQVSSKEVLAAASSTVPSKASAASNRSAPALQLPVAGAARLGARPGEKAWQPASGAPALPAVPGVAGRAAQP